MCHKFRLSFFFILIKGLARRNTIPNKGLSGSLSGNHPLPPINQTATGYDTSGGLNGERLRKFEIKNACSSNFFKVERV